MKTTHRIQPTLNGRLLRRHFLLLAALLASLAGCATNKNLQPAQATAGTGEGGFELADANHDGKLSRSEASDFIGGQVFAARDITTGASRRKNGWQPTRETPVVSINGMPIMMGR